MQKIDLTGRSYGKLNVQSEAHKRSKHTYWACRCECGKDVDVRGDALRGGVTKSCGCANIGFKCTHGLTSHELFSVWSNMVSRCHNKGSSGYKKYGERGIKVCAEWLIIENFIHDMHPRPSLKHQIDRIDGILGYFKENCRWVTGTVNARNRLDSKWWWVDGVKYDSVGDASCGSGINRATIHSKCTSGKSGYSCEAKYP